MKFDIQIALKTGSLLNFQISMSLWALQVFCYHVLMTTYVPIFLIHHLWVPSFSSEPFVSPKYSLGGNLQVSNLVVSGFQFFCLGH